MAEETLTKNGLVELNALINCDPKRCIGNQCPLYYASENKCDAKRTTEMIYIILKQKFEGVNTYEI